MFLYPRDQSAGQDCLVSNHVSSFLSVIHKVWIEGDGYIRSDLSKDRQRRPRGQISVCLPTSSVGMDDFHFSKIVADVVVVYCGGSDLGRVKSMEPLKVMKKDMLTFKQFPQMIIFSHQSEAPLEVREKISRDLRGYS